MVWYGTVKYFISVKNLFEEVDTIWWPKSFRFWRNIWQDAESRCVNAVLINDILTFSTTSSSRIHYTVWEHTLVDYGVMDRNITKDD